MLTSTPPGADPPAPALALRCDSPFADDRPFGHGFLGVWSPDHRVHADHRGPGSALAGANWFLLGHSSREAGTRVHGDRDGRIAVAFEGYTVAPGLHQRAPSGDIRAFWARHRHQRVNGSFSAAVIDTGTGELCLRTDAFGMTPLYYRATGDAVFFATQPDWLLDEDVTIDATALADRLHTGSIGGDATLYAGIRRVPLGGHLTFSGTPDDPHMHRHDLDVLDSRTRPLTAACMDEVNASLETAVRRCLELEYGPPWLPLSSGFDSRRLLGPLRDAGAAPGTATVRVLQHGNRDLDAPVAASLAAHCGSPHVVGELPEPGRYAADDAIRRALVGAETGMHGWVPTLYRLSPDRPAAVFGGLGGNTLHDPQHGCSSPGTDPPTALDRLIEQWTATPLASMLAPPLAGRGDRAERLREYLAAYAGHPSAPDLAWLALRVRRGIAVADQIRPSRHLELRPFMDLDYVAAAMAIDPEEKQRGDVRDRLLRRAHPDLAGFGGSAGDFRSVAPRVDAAAAPRLDACVRLLLREVSPEHATASLRRFTSPRARLLVAMSRAWPSSTRRWHWAVQPILETVLHPVRAPRVWRLERHETADPAAQLAG